MLRHLATRTSVLALLATPSLAQQVPAPQTSADLAQPSAEVAMHPEYAATVARSAYVWGWPMVNMLNRRARITQAPEPGFYLLVGPSWEGEVPDGIHAVIRSSTSLAHAIPRVFMNDTGEDRALIQPVIDQIVVYPLAEFDGEMKTID